MTSRLLTRPGASACVSLLAAGVVCLVVWPLSAAETRQNVPVRAFHLNRVGGVIFLDGHAKRQDQDNQGFQTKERETFAQEGIELVTSGYAYHPNFCDWNANFRLGSTQERVTVNQTDFASSGTLLGYNLSALLLKEKKFSFRPFASYSQSQQNRDFAQALKINEERHGAEVLYKSPIAATLLGEQVRYKETGDLRTTDRRTDHARVDLTDNRNRDWLTQMTYDFHDTKETSNFTPPGAAAVTEDLSDKTQELTLGNFWKFGPGKEKHSLSGRMRFLDRKGFFENQIFSFDQRLDLVHSKTFATFYRVLYTNDKTPDSLDRVAQAEAGFLKKFYKSLDVGGTLTATSQKFEGGSQDTFGGALSSAYRKKTPIGLYTCNLGLGVDQTRQQSGGGLRFIRGETVTLAGITFSRLTQPIVLGPIQVFNLTRTVQFFPGVDFITQTTGAFTEIARVPTGAILDGQAVLVDYTIEVGRDTAFETAFFNWSQRLRLKNWPLSMYTAFRTRSQTVTSGDDPGNLDNSRDILVGAEVGWKGLTVSVEHEDAFLQLSPPWTGDRIRASYHHRFTDNLDFSAGAQAERIKYKNVQKFHLEASQDHMNTAGFNAGLTAKLRGNLLLRARTDLMQTAGRQNSLLSRTSLAMEWRYGKLDFTLELRHDIFNQEANLGNADSVFVTARRRF